MYRQLRQDFSGRLSTVTLDRPERRNALSAQLMREMIACAQELSTRKDLDVVIVTGAGGFFSAGADLKDPTRWTGRATPSSACRRSRSAFRSPGARCRAL